MIQHAAEHGIRARLAEECDAVLRDEGGAVADVGRIPADVAKGFTGRPLQYLKLLIPILLLLPHGAETVRQHGLTDAAGEGERGEQVARFALGIRTERGEGRLEGEGRQRFRLALANHLRNRNVVGARHDVVDEASVLAQRGVLRGAPADQLLRAEIEPGVVAAAIAGGEREGESECGHEGRKGSSGTVHLSPPCGRHGTGGCRAVANTTERRESPPVRRAGELPQA